MKGLRGELSQTRETVHIGKKGVTEEVLKEIRRQLKERGFVKVKIEKSVIRVLERDRREVAKEVAERLGAELLEVRGRTFILIDKNGIRFSEIDRFKKNRRKGKRG
ncbi:YhbY family RNA-binding protein [Ignicoccus hospitalis]|uniref:YhbY family RNA-binding protein n=1 Tax=Ignicoccus hospitalis TaxID=160233 RepID=UPI0003267438|nr:YhbY family RNA-binding protein [Ignicoccus hospitalis]HIH90843.1 YhbY family RNA-binding protein [Desulfurococcaceae archaeon]